ncbi:MAG: type II toxin-antitoxin system VapC family toxin [Deltaproteobacteria bacterium]|nr:type II toxin-antitoxin system VapC family toxin [Deltaproteobacteria bacterium]MBW2118702.1 type II toxin-antitoxin system VapC family toxin [Deltaproteobacteria bacterium]MBW2343835.1 type II toxin-antitoxin system VapC family toxin [Deltaproteobacteria bacterium]
MAITRVVMDTDILSAVMRKNPAVIPKARAYMSEYGRFTFSIITRYEILRGLKAKRATRQAETFDLFCEKNIILSLTDEIVVKAAEIYAYLRERGELIGDADILIAASALAHGMGVVTNNENHFRRITDLHVDNWLHI